MGTFRDLFTIGKSRGLMVTDRSVFGLDECCRKGGGEMKALIFGLLMAGMLGFGTVEARAESAVVYMMPGAVAGGWVVRPETVPDSGAPAVVIFHQWGGADAYERARAAQLADLGYIVLVADIYGAGVRPTTVEEKAATAGRFRADRSMTRARAQAAVDYLRFQPGVDRDRMAVIGFCFGGMVALELARSGSDVQAVVSVHGNLDTPNPEDAAAIRAAVLIQHGAEDPYVPAEQVAAFRTAMDEAGTPYRWLAYADAVHAFTDWNAGDDPSTGAAYNETAAKAAWSDLQDFLAKQLAVAK
jgi:dienelactone hydrolase